MPRKFCSPLVIMLAASVFIPPTISSQEVYKRLGSELRDKYSSLYKQQRIVSSLDYDVFNRERVHEGRLVEVEKALDNYLASVVASQDKLKDLNNQLIAASSKLSDADSSLMIVMAQSRQSSASSATLVLGDAISVVDGEDKDGYAEEYAIDTVNVDSVGPEDLSEASIKEAERIYIEAQARVSNITKSLKTAEELYLESISSAAEAKKILDESSPSESKSADSGSLSFERDVVILQFFPSARIDEIGMLLQKYNLEVIEVIEDAGITIVKATPSTYQGLHFSAQEQSLGLALRELVRMLRRESIVRSAARNVVLVPLVVPKPTTCSQKDKLGNLYIWDWCGSCAQRDGNYGQKLMRLPAAWNLLDIMKRRVARKVRVGIIDYPLFQHEDLPVDNLPLDTGGSYAHGNNVAGVLCATFDNGLGIDGVSPFVELVAPPVPLPQTSPGVQPRPVMVISRMLRSFYTMIKDENPPKVINFSIGYNWTNNRIPANDPYEFEESEELGLQAQTYADGARGKGIIIVSAAGNDSVGNYFAEAQIGNPFNWAAVNGDATFPPAKNIIVVESVDREGHRSSVSNIHGDLSAPGENILTLGGGRDSYTIETGTSLAAPQVAGVIALMYAYNPKLTMAEVLGILKAQSTATSVPAPMIDAFEALLASRPDSLHDLADLDADGKVGLKDFEIFRNELHIMEADSSKNYFPRADLNGSGKLLRQERNKILGRDLSDLEVMMSVWEEPSVPAAALPSLLDSQQR